MLLSALLLALLAPAPPSASEPIKVTGHAWAPFISPMGEPFRARTKADDTLAMWFTKADLNHDGWLTAEEMKADARRFFTRLDDDEDGAIGPDELVHYEWEVAPDVQLDSRIRPAPGTKPAPKKKDERRRFDKRDPFLQGAARYSLLNLPEPVAAADLNFNRSITLTEFERAASDRFALLDANRRGSLNLPELIVLRERMIAEAAKKDRRHHRPGEDEDDERVATPL